MDIISVSKTKQGSFFVISDEGEYSVPDHPSNSIWNEVAEWVANGGVINVPVPSNDELVSDMMSKLESFYDSKARERRYDNRYTCSIRAGYQGPFQQEGIAFAQWMDQCNNVGYQIVADVLSGQREIPTFEQILSELPTLTWPEPIQY